MTNDTAVMRKNLRDETAAMLKLDVNNLTAAQSVRLDRASTLRLELNDIEERKLIGAPFDTVKYIAASEALERMLGGDPDQLAAETEEQMRERLVKEMFSKDAEELRELLHRRAEALERRREAQEKAAEHRAAETAASPTGQYLPIAKQRAPAVPNGTPDPPVAELMPEGSEPPKQPRVEFVEHEPSPLRHSSMNLPNSRPTPPSEKPRSPVTESFFQNIPGAINNFKRWDPPSGW
jgi:hypothetical protein